MKNVSLFFRVHVIHHLCLQCFFESNSTSKTFVCWSKLIKIFLKRWKFLHCFVNLFCSFWRDEITRHLYYLQLRKDVLEGNIYVHEETALLLASYALQAEVRHELGSGGPSSLYFAPEKYLPQRVCSHFSSVKLYKGRVLAPPPSSRNVMQKFSSIADIKSRSNHVLIIH